MLLSTMTPSREGNWLSDLESAYQQDSEVAAVGGLVWDRTGAHLQYRFAVCDRLGRPDFKVRLPLDRFSGAGADPFLYLQGTNTSFRREVLQKVGAYDELIELYYDDSDIACRLIDAGFHITALEKAGIHHKTLPSTVRDSKRIILDPYKLLRDRAYFTIRHGIPRYGETTVLDVLREETAAKKNYASRQYAAGTFNKSQYDKFLLRVDEAIATGIRVAREQPRKLPGLVPRDLSSFVQFPVKRPQTGRRLRAIYISKEYPPFDFGGVARVMHDAAVGMAHDGHEVHIITGSSANSRVDFEEDTWVHRVHCPDLCLQELRDIPLSYDLYQQAIVYRTYRRIADAGKVDCVGHSLWLAEGMICELDNRSPVFLFVQTATKPIMFTDPAFQTPHMKQLSALEDAQAQLSRYVHASTQAMLRRLEKDYGKKPEVSALVPLGVIDRAHLYHRKRAPKDNEVRLLFVGRMEKRKGVDVLLKAVVPILRRHPEFHVYLVGKDSVQAEMGRTYHEAYMDMHANEPDLFNRTHFVGMVSEIELYQHYADCDMFVLPSRYESFGLVLIEAMMFGKPCIACRVGGMLEVVAEGDSGLLAEPNDAHSLERAIEVLVSDHDLRARMGGRGRDTFVERFTHLKMASSIAKAFASAADEHTAIATKLKDEDPQERDRRISTRYGEIIARCTTVSTNEAKSIARQLVTCSNDDSLAAAVRTAMQSPSHEGFVCSLYLTLLRRDADSIDKRHYVSELNRGRSRHDVLQEVASVPRSP